MVAARSLTGSWSAEVFSAPHLVALVRAGAILLSGQLVERPAEQAAT
jgi:hypothetical protein